MKKVLLVEDNADMAFMTAEDLTEKGFDVTHIIQGENAFNYVTQLRPDIVLLDIELGSSVDGFAIARQIREAGIMTPILYTTGRSAPQDFMTGFSVENVDYLKKPYGATELYLRIQKLLKESVKKRNEQGFYRFGKSFEFNPDEHILMHNGKSTSLTKSEAMILLLLCENVGSLVKKETIVSWVWTGSEPSSKSHSLNNAMYRFRKILGPDSDVTITTIAKEGFKLSVNKS